MKKTFTILALLLLSSLSLASANEFLYENGGTDVCRGKTGTLEMTYKSSGIFAVFGRSKLTIKDSVVGTYRYNEAGFFPKDYSLNFSDLQLAGDIEALLEKKDYWPMIVFNQDEFVVVRADTYKTVNSIRSFDSSEYFVIKEETLLSHFSDCR